MTSEVFLYLSLSLLFEAGSLTEPEALQFGLAGWPRGPAPSALGLETTTASFLHGHWGPTLRSLYLDSRHLCTDPPPQNSSFFKGLIFPLVRQSPCGSLNSKCSPRFGITSFRMREKATLEAPALQDSSSRNRVRRMQALLRQPPLCTSSSSPRLPLSCSLLL